MKMDLLLTNVLYMGKKTVCVCMYMYAHVMLFLHYPCKVYVLKMAVFIY